MSTLTLALQAAQAPEGAIPCRTYDSEYWFAEDAVTTAKAQRLCGKCPLKLTCLAEAISRGESCGVWGGELFDRGQVVARHKPKGRPRKDAEEIAAVAAARVTARLNELSTAIAHTEPEISDLVERAATEIRVA